MFELILLAIGLLGLGFAGYRDLKTTEFPDWIPYSVIVLAIFIRGVFSYLMNDFSILADSLIIGGLFLAFGLILYFSKQWGDGDAWLFGCMGFLFPANPFGVSLYFPFPATLFFNFFFVSLFYIVIYSMLVGLKNPFIFASFKKEIKNNFKWLAPVIAIFVAAYISMVFLFFGSVEIPARFLLIPAAVVLLALFAVYGRLVEKDLFRKKIHASKLRPGDVPQSARWRVLRPEEIQKMKKSGGYVWIKEGVRFAPVFAISLVASLFFGDVFFLLMQIFV
jgi:Flp pilus assembly protein protease CpaA